MGVIRISLKGTLEIQNLFMKKPLVLVGEGGVKVFFFKTPLGRG